MVEPGHQLALVAKALHVRFGQPAAGLDHLESHQAVGAFLPSFVDHTHAAPADFFEQLVIPEGAALTFIIRVRSPRGREALLRAAVGRGQETRAERRWSEAVKRGVRRYRAPTPIPSPEG